MFNMVTFAFILTIFIFSSHGKLKVKGQEDIYLNGDWRILLILQKKMYTKMGQFFN